MKTIRHSTLAAISLTLIALTGAPARADDAAAAPVDPVVDLAQRSGCLSCHDIKSKVVGPAYQAVALRYKDDPTMVDTLVQKILNGSKGAWGNRAAMPPNNVTPEEARQLATWVLSLVPH